MVEKNAIQASTLYLVATPIGNLEDMTFRALKVLKEVNLIAAEDTRNTSKLLSHFGIQSSKLVSCYEHNEIKRTGDILETLARGGAVALVTDAGMPGISDPGYQVVKMVLEKGFTVVPIPGACALVAALPASGLVPTPFLFAGFLSSKAGDRRKAMMKLKTQEPTLVFYESPHRLTDFLKDALEIFGPRHAVIARELSKLHEEFRRGTLEELLDHFRAQKPLGEFVVLVDGVLTGSTDQVSQWQSLSIEEHLMELMKKDGLTKTAAIKAVAKARHVPRNEVYQAAIRMGDSDKHKKNSA